MFKDLYIDNSFASFQQLSEKCSLPKQHFFRYLQIHSFVSSRFPQFPNLPAESPLDTFLKPAPALKGMMSHFYAQIHFLRLVSLNSIKSFWEADLGEEITEELWEDALDKLHKSSICAKHGLIQCKIVHRTHLTKVRLSQIYKDVDPTCDRCHQAPASHVHMFWSCSALQSYWEEIFRSMSKVAGKLIKPNAMTALFGVSLPMVPLSSLEAAFIAFVTLLARRLTLFKWKCPTAPSHTVWIKEIFNCVNLEKIRCIKNGSLRKFSKMWDLFFKYVQELDFRETPE